MSDGFRCAFFDEDRRKRQSLFVDPLRHRVLSLHFFLSYHRLLCGLTSSISSSPLVLPRRLLTKYRSSPSAQLAFGLFGLKSIFSPTPFQPISNDLNRHLLPSNIFSLRGSIPHERSTLEASSATHRIQQLRLRRHRFLSHVIHSERNHVYASY